MCSVYILGILQVLRQYFLEGLNTNTDIGELDWE